MTQYLLAIDQGTTSTRCILFDPMGQVHRAAQYEHQQIYPQPGWVEHDALEIMANVDRVIAEALTHAGLDHHSIAAIGVTNQRETIVVWDKTTGTPVHPALVWQDTRTDQICAQLAARFGNEVFQQTTGLPISTYFSGPKLKWLLDEIPGLKARAERGELLFGTIDTWIIWNLTGGVHVTDVTNASRTLLMNLETLNWDPGLLELMAIPNSLLPRICSSSEIYGLARGPLEGVPIAGILGDQQAALFGQAAFLPGESKNTYGTGCFMLMNVGAKPLPSRHGLLSTVAYQLGTAAPVYALEGSIAITGALVQWLRDNLGLIQDASEIEALAQGVPDNGGVYFVPAFSGLYAPHWRPDARGIIAGLTRFAHKGHLARAALEATAFQTEEIIRAMEKDSGQKISTLKVDGGMVVNDLLMQFQADILGMPVIRPPCTETTALGAASVAGLAVGFWSGTDELRARWTKARTWTPTMDASRRSLMLADWHKAVQRTLNWA